MRKWIAQALGIRRRRRARSRHHRKSLRVEARHKGLLHRRLRVPLDQKIPLKLLHQAAKRSGSLGRQARLALTLRGFGKR